MNKTSLIETRTDPLIMDLPFSEEEYQRRLAACRELMTEKGVDAFVSFTPENIYYLTGHDTPGYYYLQACVVTHDHDPVVFTRKIESFNTLGRSWKRLTCPYGDTDNPVMVLSALLGEKEWARDYDGAPIMEYPDVPMGKRLHDEPLPPFDGVPEEEKHYYPRVNRGQPKKYWPVNMNPDGTLKKTALKS